MGFIGETFALALDSGKRLVPFSHLQHGDQNATWRYRQAIRWYLAALWQTRRLPPSEILSLQTYRLNKVIRAAARTPWWQTRFSDAGIDPAASVPFDALKALSPSKKSDLVSVQPKDLCLNIHSKFLLWRTTTGTDGMPITWAQDMRTHFLEDAAYYLRSLEHFSFPVKQHIQRKFVLMINNPMNDVHFLAFFARSVQLSYLGFGRETNYIPPREKRLEAYKVIRNAGPVVLHGTPSAFWFLAQLAEVDQTQIRPELILTVGEVLTDDMRSYFGRAFHCEIKSFYGTRELGPIGFSCDAENNLFHVNSENILLEIINDDGSQCADGEYGRLVITSLTNLSMPLLRYQSGDIGRFVGGSCACKITLPRFELAGRNSEFLILPNETKTPVWQLCDAILAEGRFFKIRQYQIRQVAKDEIVILIVAKQAWLNIDSERLIRTVQYRIGSWLKIDIKLVEHIEKHGHKHRPFVALNVQE